MGGEGGREGGRWEEREGGREGGREEKNWREGRRAKNNVIRCDVHDGIALMIISSIQ